MSFKEWMQEAKEEINTAVNSNLDKLNQRQQTLIPAYTQYQVFQQTKKLVIATWALAVVTIILAIATFINKP